MPARAVSPLAEASSPSGAGAAAARKARFWDRIAVKYAADPIADMAGYEATLRPGGLLIFDAAELQSAIARQGMEIVSVERHGTRGKDFRVFIVARKPA